MDKKCPECGKFFTCHDTGDCWCEDYQILKAEMYKIMNSWEDCICPSCLSEFSEN